MKLLVPVKFYAQNINGVSEDVRLSKRLTLPSNRLRGFETNKVGPQDGSEIILAETTQQL